MTRQQHNLIAGLILLLAVAPAHAAAATPGFFHEAGFTEPSPLLGSDLLAPARPGQYFEFIPIHPVHFGFNEDRLDDRARWHLDDTAQLIRHLRGVTRVIIKGHTDVVADVDFNDALSDRRALAVRDYLLERGVAPHLLDTTGYGKHMSVDEDWTREGRARNRRVEIYVVRYGAD